MKKWIYFNGKLERTQANTRITDFKEIEIIDTKKQCCCNCIGNGEECEKGGAWIYCDIRNDFDEKFNGCCGETKGCNAFKPLKNMKALTNKIIELIENQAKGQFNEFAKKQLLLVVEQIKEAEKDAEFEEIARVMMKYLAEKHHPHTKVIVESNRAEMIEGVKCCNTDEYLVD